MHKNQFLALLFSFLFLNQINAQYTKLIDFDGINGASPNGSLLYDGTYLYGMTSEGGTIGGGVIFKIKSDGTGDTVLHSFTGTDGSSPEGSLITDGTYLYGMTYLGGADFGGAGTGHAGNGTVFKIKPDGTGYTTVVPSFTIGNCAEPFGSLYYDGTYLYGTTIGGGTGGNGIVFKVKTDGTQFINLYNFDTAHYGSGQGAPYGSLISDGTYLYGTISAAVTSNAGMVFKIKPDGTGFDTVINFNNFGGLYGSKPFGDLTYDGTYLYGMTSSGGILGNNGVIFKIKPDGNGYNKLLDFNGVNGSRPWGSLLYDGAYLYGVTPDGGAYNHGVVFRINTDGTNYIDVYDFNRATIDSLNGYFPSGKLITDGNYLYGMTYYGGAYNYASSPYGDGNNGKGVIFKIDKNNISGIAKLKTQNSQIKLYPNPASSTLQVTGINYNDEIKVCDVLGNKVMVKPTPNPSAGGELLSIDVSALPNGVYFIMAGASTQKFIVQH